MSKHSLGPSAVVLVILLGCGKVAEEDTRPAAASPGPDAAPPTSAATSSPAPPAASSTSTGSPATPPPPTMNVTCQQAFEVSNGSCDDKTFGTCSRAVAGIPCCTRMLRCDKGTVVEEVACTDSCAQGCGLVTNAADCVAYACTWFVGGCPPAPPGVIEGPTCVGKLGSECASDDDCADDEQCKDFWSDPCAGGNCGACGAAKRFCTVR